MKNKIKISKLFQEIDGLFLKCDNDDEGLHTYKIARFIFIFFTRLGSFCFI